MYNHPHPLSLFCDLRGIGKGEDITASHSRESSLPGTFYLSISPTPNICSSSLEEGVESKPGLRHQIPCNSSQ
jgi:hypothetical protein